MINLIKGHSSHRIKFFFASHKITFLCLTNIWPCPPGDQGHCSEHRQSGSRGARVEGHAGGSGRSLATDPTHNGPAGDHCDRSDVQRARWHEEPAPPWQEARGWGKVEAGGRLMKVKVAILNVKVISTYVHVMVRHLGCDSKNRLPNCWDKVCPLDGVSVSTQLWRTFDVNSGRFFKF